MFHLWCHRQGNAQAYHRLIIQESVFLQRGLNYDWYYHCSPIIDQRFSQIDCHLKQKQRRICRKLQKFNRRSFHHSKYNDYSKNQLMLSCLSYSLKLNFICNFKLQIMTLKEHFCMKSNPMFKRILPRKKYADSTTLVCVYYLFSFNHVKITNVLQRNRLYFVNISRQCEEWKYSFRLWKFYAFLFIGMKTNITFNGLRIYENYFPYTIKNYKNKHKM